MEIILLENILNLGNIGDKVSVKNGYGRNFLLKQGKALRFNKENEELVSKKCPLSIKNAPIVDYKNVSLLKKYISDNGKIISSKITSVSFSKQKKLNREIKRAKILGLL